jgi:hypothetical protein
MLDQGVIIEDRIPYHWNPKPSVSPIKSRELDRADSLSNHSNSTRNSTYPST